MEEEPENQNSEETLISPEEIKNKQDFREIAAIFCGLLSFILVIGVVITSYYTTHALLISPPQDIIIFLIILTSRVVLSATLLGFAYFLLRMTERLLIPRHLLRDAKDAELIKVLLGQSQSARSKPFTYYLKTISDFAPNVLKSATELLQAIQQQKGPK